MAFLHALDISNHLQPPYTATVIVEFYDFHDVPYAVKVMYRNETDHEPYVMKIPGDYQLIMYHFDLT